MKDPYELRVIADALERWSEGPAINAMKYAMVTLREIADEVEASLRPVTPEVHPDAQQPIPSSPIPAVEGPSENPTGGAIAEAWESPVTSTSEPAASSLIPDTGASAPSVAENPTQLVQATESSGPTP